ncbi:MAG: creatininase family protein [Armatimonadetes bacterium]|nr:creatininase family protein [Armatimonadota bacterium]
MKRARMMYDMTVKDIGEGLEETRTVILPVGIVEQHGYHLPTSVDIHNAYEIARMTSDETGCFVAPPVHYNFSGGMLPGTINISPQVFSLMLIDILQSLVMQGFKNLIILLGHGGTESGGAAKDAAEYFQRLRPEMAGVTVCLVPFWELSPTYMKHFNEGDYHAALCETSLMLYWKPELVKMDEAVFDDPEMLSAMRADPDAYAQKIKRLDNKFVVPRIAQNPAVKVGVMGDFRGANAEFGRKIAEECVSALAAIINDLDAADGGS